MTNVLDRATKGKRDALEALYETYKTDVAVLCRGCLGNTESAFRAAEQAFSNTWSHLLSSGFQTEEAFKQYLMKNAALVCRKSFVRKGMKTLPIPQNKNFMIVGKLPDPPAADAIKMDSFLDALPGVNRYLFVLHRIACLDQKTISSITGYKSNVLELAFEAEQRNSDRILSQLELAAGERCDLAECIEEYKADTQIPKSIEETIKNHIQEVVKPFESKRKKQRIMMAVLGVALTAILTLVCVKSFSGSSQTEANTEDVTLTDTSLSETYTEPESFESDTVLETEVSVIDGDIAQSCYFADIEIADYGTVTVRLDSDAAPLTVENFISLASSGFYDGLTFHRIMDGFMIQGGDPEGNGTGGSDNTILGEFSDNGYENNLSHTRGAISMARSSNDYDSASSQFFIVQTDSTFLDGQYACFGYVTEGMEIVDAICADAEPTDDNGTIPADQQPIILSIAIRDEASSAENE